MRLILILIALFLVWRLVAGYLKMRRAGRPPNPGQPPAVDMVACAHCGMHVPVTEAVFKEGRSYCCRAHAEAAR